MRKFVKVSILLVICVTSLVMADPVLAVPPLPSSFYGIVKVNGANVPDGTLIQALIDGRVYAEGLTQTYQGDSVYALDIPGDDTQTTVREGGRDGETIRFKIGGMDAVQTGTWVSGTNVNLDLSTASTGTLLAPQDTPAPIPTQTPIILVVQPSPTYSPTPTPPSPTPTTISQPFPTATERVQPSPTPPAPVNSGEGSSDTDSIFVLFIVGFVAIAVLLFLLLIFKRKGVTRKSGSKN